jgi:hypothetical protein
MPLATNPKRTFPVTLESDKDLPEAERPTFRFRFPTGTQVCELEDFQAGLKAVKKSQGQLIKELDGLLTPFLAGWDNLCDGKGNLLVYGMSTRLMDVLAMDDLWHLFWALVYATVNTVAEKNLSDSPSDASTGIPAEAGSPATAVLTGPKGA